MLIMLVIGVRPQVIKAAPLIKLLYRDPEVNFMLIHSGQHYDFEMSKIFFNEFDLPNPDVNLGIGSGSHAEQTAKIILKLEPLILNTKPDVVVVFGDANTTLGSALAAIKLNVPVAHVEAGLRSWDLSMPEEINRILTDHCSQILYAPTKYAFKNLIYEGIPKDMILLSGDTMYDSILLHLGDIDKSRIVEEFDLEENNFIVVTAHRAENVDSPIRLSNMVNALLKLNSIKIVFPVHPRTRKNLIKFGLIDKLKRAHHIILTNPLGYFDMLKLIKTSSLVLTDSGGIQKEAFILNTPCITMRSRTEWIETILSGANTLVSINEELIVKKALQILKRSKEIKEKLASIPKPYGNGNASEIIVNDLKSRIASGTLKVGPIKAFTINNY